MIARRRLPLAIAQTLLISGARLSYFSLHAEAAIAVTKLGITSALPHGHRLLKTADEYYGAYCHVSDLFRDIAQLFEYCCCH